MSTSRADRQPAGLRERKKARTRAAIQDHALRLFIEQGYEATTVEQIAAAAEVSQSTFFRYFPAKEDTLGYDRLDPIFAEAFMQQPADLAPITALRKAMHEVLAAQSREATELEQARQRLIFGVPELRARLFEQVSGGLEVINDALAARVGRSSEDFAVRMWSGAVIGVVLAAYFGTLDDEASLMTEIDRGLAQLEAGLPL